ncbi:MAG: hypothetical protein NTY19_05890 [Planctomycetota bacterium]|nr:hypothetical protein [Planctomycetota bacterium]
MTKLADLCHVVSAGVYDPTVGKRRFFGEDCLLLSAAREALTTGAGEAFKKTCEALLTVEKDIVCQIYGVSDRDQDVWDQGNHLLHGLTGAALAACDAGGDVDWDRLKKAAQEFDAAWPGLPGTSLPAYHVADYGVLRRYCQELGCLQSTGFWVVWDILDALVPEYTYSSKDLRPKVRTASLPILLYRQDDSGQVARLTVDLILDGGQGFRPDPLKLGLTALGPEGNGSFLAAMGNAWRYAGLSQKCRGRWGITKFCPPERDENKVENFATPYLFDRSVEVAACCAIWAAWGALPGDERDEHLQLDPLGTVTATLAGEPGADVRLGPVRELRAKLQAAREAGLQEVVVADEHAKQDKKVVVDYRDDPEVVPLKTLRDAFEQLLSYHRILIAYQESVKAKWLEQWQPGTADV